MDSQKSSRFKKPEILILFICLFGLLATGYEMFFAKRESNSTKHEMSVGFIKPTGSDVRVKGEIEMDWNPVYRDVNVFRNDRVYTGQNSQAKVKLKTDEKFTIEPNSLVVFSDNKDKKTIEFSNGGLLAEIRKGAEIFIKFKNKITKITASDDSTLRFQSSKDKPLQLVVLRGQAAVNSNKESDPPQIIKANEQAEINETNVTAKVLDISLISPEPGNNLWNQDKSVEFKWQTSKQTPVILEISKSPEFNDKDTITKNVNSNTATVSLPTSGFYFWRIRSTSSSDLNEVYLSPVSSFSLQQLVSPRVSEKDEITLEANANGLISTKVHFIWNDIIASDEFDIEIAKDPLFHEIEFQKRVESTTIDVSDLHFGKFYWRVRSYGKGRESLLSNVGVLSIYKKELPLPLADAKPLVAIRNITAQAPPAPLVVPATPTPPKEVPVQKVEVKKLEPDKNVVKEDKHIPPPKIKPVQRVERIQEAKKVNPDPEKPTPIVFSKVKEKDFWLWFGLGENYLFYQQNVPSISGNFKFQNVQGPTRLLITGFKATNKWGGEFSYKETPGKMNSSKNINVDKGEFTWKTTTGEAFYYLDDPNSFIRTGFQCHVMPFMQMDTSTNLLNIRDNTLTTLSIGFQKNYSLKDAKLRGEWMMRYQYPIMAGSTNGDSFSISPELAFDGSVGMVYLYDDIKRLGLFWYGQYHQYKFKYNSTSDSFSGQQVLFYSNVELRLGWEF